MDETLATQRNRLLWALPLALSGCLDVAANDVGSPETAQREFFRALRSRDDETAWAFLDGATRQALGERAAALTIPPGVARPPASELLLAVNLAPGPLTSPPRRVGQAPEGSVRLQWADATGATRQLDWRRDKSGWTTHLDVQASVAP